MAVEKNLNFIQMNLLNSSLLPAFAAMHLASCTPGKEATLDTGDTSAELESVASFSGEIRLNFHLQLTTVFGVCADTPYSLTAALDPLSEPGEPLPLLIADGFIPDSLTSSGTTIADGTEWGTLSIELAVEGDPSECPLREGAVEFDAADLGIHGSSEGTGYFDVDCSMNPYGLGFKTDFFASTDLSCALNDATWTPHTDTAAE